MNTKSMKIPYAFSPIVNATLDDGSVAELAVIGNKGGNLLVKNISENVVYELRITSTTVPNMLVFDVVWSNAAPEP